MVNKVILIGNLGKEPDVRTVGESKVAKFPVATNESYKDKSGDWQTKTEWHEVIVWRHLAERADRDFKKGSLVFIEGKLTHRKYQDKDGNDRYITEVVASQAYLLEKRESGGGSNQGSSFPTEEKAGAIAAAPTNSNEDTGEDDLPF